MPASPHDHFFKDVFMRRDCAAAHFRVFLPPAVRAVLDLGTLELVSGSFVDADLRELHSDLLYRVRGAGQEAFVYLLFEHQSTVEPMMALRVMRYVMRIWHRWRDDHPACHMLPPVVPMVLYNGETAWSAPTDLRELPGLAGPGLEALLVHAPSGGFVLVDLSEIDDGALRAVARTGATFAGLALLILKHARAPDLTERFARWHDLVRASFGEAGTGFQAFEALLRYVLETNSSVDARALGATLAAHTTERVLDMAMSTADKLRDEGRVEGRVEGQVEGARELLLFMLRSRFPDVGDVALERMRLTTLEDIRRWTERILAARSADELFGSST